VSDAFSTALEQLITITAGIHGRSDQQTNWYERSMPPRRKRARLDDSGAPTQLGETAVVNAAGQVGLTHRVGWNGTIAISRGEAK